MEGVVNGEMMPWGGEHSPGVCTAMTLSHHMEMRWVMESCLKFASSFLPLTQTKNTMRQIFNT